MIFDLVAGDRRLDLLDHGFQERNVEIGDADGAGTALLLQFHQGFEHFGQVHVFGRPVHQIEIDHVQPELLQGSIERPADRIRRQILVPDFCRDMQIATRNAGGGDGGADRLLIAVHFGGVDMAVAQRQRAFDRRATGLGLHAKGAEPEPRQADALGLQMFHGDSLKG